MPLTTLQDLADYLATLTPNERQYPAYFLTDQAIGRVQGFRRLDQPVSLHVQQPAFLVELPIGMPVLEVELTGTSSPVGEGRAA